MFNQLYGVHITPHHATSYYSFGGEHTHTQAQTHAHIDVLTETILRNQVHASLWPAHAWFKKAMKTVLGYV